jgi:hypothetical protein
MEEEGMLLMAFFVNVIRFHGVEDAPYTLPNDEDELERLADLQNCIKLFFGRNILAPIGPKPSLIGNHPPCHDMQISDE